MRASRAAGFGARAQRFVHDLFDGAGAPAALRAAAETSIDLPRRPWRHLRDAHSVSYIMVSKNVAGTDDHETERHSLDGSND
jgi:hypothetical protein